MSTFGPYRGVVERVVDGDTVYAKLDLGFDLTAYARIRVYGINAPELNTAEGRAARDFAQAVLPVAGAVEVLSHGWDKYGGRIDAEIRAPDGRDFAQVMLDAGHAVPYFP